MMVLNHENRNKKLQIVHCYIFNYKMINNKSYEVLYNRDTTNCVRSWYQMPTYTNKQSISWNVTLCNPLFLETIIYAISVFYVTQVYEGLKAKPVLKLQ
jgi:hypothetical protein